MQLIITADLKINDCIVAKDAEIEIHANFREFINASADHAFELDDWDITGVSWDGLTGHAEVTYPVRRMAHTAQQVQLDNEHRQKIRGMLENLRSFIPLTDAEIEQQLLAAYAKQR